MFSVFTLLVDKQEVKCIYCQ